MADKGLSTFVNREDELAALAGWFERPGPGFGVVYGRRRVGKTWLIAKFAQGRRVIQHTARGRTIEAELAVLSEAAHPVLNLPRRSLRERPFLSWDDLFEHAAASAETEPLLIVLDEFPELLAVESHLEEELRAVWDRVGIENTNLKVIVSGSAVRVMEGLLEHKGALFGRADLRMPVQPLRPHEAALLLPNAQPAERAAAWGVCGGIPRYLALWDDTATFTQNIARLVCNEQGIFFDEGDLVLKDEDIVGHRGKRLPEQILRAVADGSTTYSTITNAVGKLPTRALDDLVASRLLHRANPVGTDPKETKLSYYRIGDNFLAFWLTCVEPHRAAIEQGLGNGVIGVIEESFSDYMGSRYEQAFREHLARLVREGQLGDVVDLGEWWRTQGAASDDPCQLDAVGLVGRQRIPQIVGEAKWARKVNGSSLLGKMTRKLHESKLADPNTVTFYVCAREQVERSDGMQVVTAADIFTS